MNPKFLEPLRSQRVSGNFSQQADDMRTTEGAETNLGVGSVIRIAHVKVRVSKQPQQSHEVGLEQKIHMDERADTTTIVEVPLRVRDVRPEWRHAVLNCQP